jgi:ribose transport system permease protein
MSITTRDSFGLSLRRLRYRWSPRLVLSELLLKPWFEQVIPFAVMIGLMLYFSLTINDYASSANFLSLMRLYAEFGFVALGMAFCLITGGIDLSVGAIFAVSNSAALAYLYVLGLPAWAAILATLATAPPSAGSTGCWWAT